MAKLDPRKAARRLVHAVAKLVPDRLGHWAIRQALARGPGQEARLLNLGRVFYAGEPLVVELPAGFTMALHLDDHIERRIFYTGRYEAPVEHLLRRCLERGDGVVVDVGANTGYYALLASRLLGGRGVVHAFEPFPATFTRLERNVALNPHGGSLRARAEAAAAAHGQLELHAVPGNLGETSVARSGGVTVSVPTVPLDDLLAEEPEGSVALAKIDVEGAELLVLDGMPVALERGVCANLLIEVHPRELEQLGQRPEALAERLSAARYELFAIDEGRLQALDSVRFFGTSVGHRFIFATRQRGWLGEPVPAGF